MKKEYTTEKLKKELKELEKKAETNAYEFSGDEFLGMLRGLENNLNKKKSK